MVKRKKKLIKIFKCPIEGCDNYLGYAKGEEAWRYRHGVGYKMVESEMEVAKDNA